MKAVTLYYYVYLLLQLIIFLLCYDDHHAILTSFLFKVGHVLILHAHFTALGERAKNYAVTDFLQFNRKILFQRIKSFKEMKQTRNYCLLLPIATNSLIE